MKLVNAAGRTTFLSGAVGFILTGMTYIGVSGASSLVLPHGHIAVNLRWQNSLESGQSFSGTIGRETLTGRVRFPRSCGGTERNSVIVGSLGHITFKLTTQPNCNARVPVLAVRGEVDGNAAHGTLRYRRSTDMFSEEVRIKAIVDGLRLSAAFSIPTSAQSTIFTASLRST
jgi:hypothetical protein